MIIRKRPAWAKVMNLVRAGGVDILLVEEVSRLGFEDEWELAALCHELRQHHTQLIEAKSDRVVNATGDASIILDRSSWGGQPQGNGISGQPEPRCHGSPVPANWARTRGVRSVTG